MKKKPTIILIAAFSLLGSFFVLGALAKTEKALVAGGCFWCMEPPFDKLEGVISTTSGYAGGVIKEPSYEDVSSGKTKHREAVLIEFNASKISYREILQIFWKQINPTDSGGQFVDRGFQYTTAIFYYDEEQRKIAEQTLENFQKKIDKTLKTKEGQKFAQKSNYYGQRLGSKIVTPIIQYTTFYPAEDYHQDFYKRSTYSRKRYKQYRKRSGRDIFIALW